MQRRYQADLHVHTCLSPCADLSMGPRAIVERARERGLDLIGISDHNSTDNSAAVRNAACGRLAVLPGMEVTSKEEVHILALFDTLDNALELQAIVYEHLSGENDPEVFGMQVLVNEDHDVLGYNPRLLAGATDLTVETVVDSIHELEGLAIASHADRESFGLLGQLGFIPVGLRLDALEISSHTSDDEARQRFPSCAGFPLVRFSDAHSLDDIGRASTAFLLEEPTVAEMRRSLRG